MPSGGSPNYMGNSRSDARGRLFQRAVLTAVFRALCTGFLLYSTFAKRLSCYAEYRDSFSSWFFFIFLDLSMICVNIVLLTGLLTYGIVCLTWFLQLTVLTYLKQDLIHSIIIIIIIKRQFIRRRRNMSVDITRAPYRQNGNVVRDSSTDSSL